MELSYLEDWIMAKCAIIPICEAGKLFLWQNLLKWVDFDIGGNVVNTRVSLPVNYLLLFFFVQSLLLYIYKYF